ncbi:lmbr1 domain containing 1 [Plakobranchus ocellatus]|uniref:Lmbr1 domain containing 1 n=1 Tax=Plakobranchus ocellatus TaxID=259542 RepID=A0AAV3Z0R5_9GAST|nr:lmbr1 domain containing 1 [Plakobranchus ocellatus]
MAIPGSVIAAGWIPFVVVLVLTVLFSTFYVRYFMHKYDSEIAITVTAIIALTLTLLTSALVPVDIFLVSYMKDSDGTFKDWAQNLTVRNDVEDSVLVTYYVFYGIVAFFLFLLLPFMYFFYEEKDENSTFKARCCASLKYCIVCVIIAVVFLLIGALVPGRSSPNANSTEWQKIDFLLHDMNQTRLEDALSFVISIFTLVGMLLLIMYTAYGMSAMPMDLIKGQGSAKAERLQTQKERQQRQRQRQAIRQKYSSRSTMSSRAQRVDDILAAEESLISRQERHLQAAERSWLNKCWVLLRPFEIVIGVVCFVVALLVFLSLLLTNIDKAIHGMGYKSGYALPKRHLPNPVDIALVYCQKAFPLDYILMVGIIAYFVLCSMSGIRNIGVWFLWIRMYKIRPRRTSPQGLLMFCMILMFIVLGINVILYELTPQYSSFGSQHYVTESLIDANVTTSDVKECTMATPPEACTVTRMVYLLVTFFYDMWIFGAAYYYLTWLFLAVILIGFIVAVVKRRRSAIRGEVDEDDFEESDDEELLRG